MTPPLCVPTFRLNVESTTADGRRTGRRGIRAAARIVGGRKRPEERRRPPERIGRHTFAQPPQPPDQDFTDLQVKLGLRIYRQLFGDAVAAYFRHRPGLEIKKGKPGRKPNVKQMERILKLHSSKSYREIAKEELQAEPEGEAKNLLIEKERERIRAAARRARRRSRT